jgi:hypothetical protein
MLTFGGMKSARASCTLQLRGRDVLLRTQAQSSR